MDNFITDGSAAFFARGKTRRGIEIPAQPLSVSDGCNGSGDGEPGAQSGAGP
jgi:hypothetical protein